LARLSLIRLFNRLMPVALLAASAVSAQPGQTQTHWPAQDGTHTQAAVWKDYLIEFLKETDKK